jgi:hypothetical protein
MRSQAHRGPSPCATAIVDAPERRFSYSVTGLDDVALGKWGRKQ